MASIKSNGLEPSDWARAPVDAGPMWLRCLKIIYNPEEKSVFGRTAKRWGIVLVFYAVFYAVLAAMFACCMAGLNYSLDKNKPKWTLDQSLIGSNPGVAHRPLPTDGLVVKYDKSNSSHLDAYVKQLEDFLKLYEEENPDHLECLATENYGFPDNPCFFIKLNKLYDWKPEYYEKDSLPTDMPEDLKEYIMKEDTEPHQVWISCEEEKGVNSTVITYPWMRGFPGSKFPYLNQEGYRSPVIAIKLKPPTNQLVIIRCRAWAKNIHYDRSIKEPRGYTRIQLHLEDTSTD